MKLSSWSMSPRIPLRGIVSCTTLLLTRWLHHTIIRSIAIVLPELFAKYWNIDRFHPKQLQATETGRVVDGASPSYDGEPIYYVTLCHHSHYSTYYDEQLEDVFVLCFCDQPGTSCHCQKYYLHFTLTLCRNAKTFTGFIPNGPEM